MWAERADVHVDSIQAATGRDRVRAAAMNLHSCFEHSCDSCRP